MNRLAVEIKNMSAFQIRCDCGDESVGSVGHVLKVRAPAKTNVERTTNHGGLHGFRRIGSQAKVAADSIDSQRPQSDAVYSMIEMIDPGIALIAAFEYAVVGGWPRLVSFRHRLFFFHQAKNPPGARVCNTVGLVSE